MRASQQQQTGGAGIGEVSAAFERLGWGPVENHRHDLGTDLFLQVRDARLYELGLIVGAQVKAGASYFRDPALGGDGQPVGWWFRTDRAHADYWLAHSVPHLVVLHESDSHVSYWAHVTADAMVSTGAGAKILVPKVNTVDVEHRDSLLKVAGARQPGVAWEGSVWMAGADIPAAARLRHALIVPRLIAPHPNAARDRPISPEQAAAMVMQARLRELGRYAEQFDAVPHPAEATNSGDWGWQFVGALYARVTGAGTEPLIAAADQAADPAGRAAATVAATSALTEDGDADRAAELLSEAISRDDAEPVDQAWLRVQRARAHAEIGLLDEARADAVAAQASRTAAPNDATASAVAASAAILLFNTSSWGERDLEQVITGADTAASWWRAQTTSRGLDAIVERSFSQWARDTSTTFGAEDTANNQLHASAIAASHAGEQSGWRYLSALGATDQLLRLDRHSDPVTAADALTALRLAGDEKAVKLAVAHLAADGPARAVTLAASRIDLGRSTRTTGRADLQMIETGGDLIDQPTATAFIRWLLAASADPARFAERTSASYLLPHQFIETLTGVIAAGDPAGQAETIEYLLALPAIADQYPAAICARLVEALPADAWTEQHASRAANRARNHHEALRLALQAVAVRRGDENVRSQLVDEAAGGSFDATAALADVRDLPPQVVETQVRSLSEAARRMRADANRGKHDIGSDVGRALALLNLWHPDLADWPPLVDLLGDEEVSADHKRGALRLLAEHAERIPPMVGNQLKPIAADIAAGKGKVVPGFFGEMRDASGEASLLAAAVGGLDEERAGRQLLALTHGGPGDRRWAAALAGSDESREHTGILSALTADQHPHVRAAAGAGLARRLSAGDSSPIVTAALEICVEDPGTWVPARLAASLQSTETAAAGELLERLRQHPSAHVRHLAGAAWASG